MIKLTATNLLLKSFSITVINNNYYYYMRLMNILKYSLFNFCFYFTSHDIRTTVVWRANKNRPITAAGIKYLNACDNDITSTKILTALRKVLPFRIYGRFLCYVSFDSVNGVGAFTVTFPVVVVAGKHTGSTKPAGGCEILLFFFNL